MKKTLKSDVIMKAIATYTNEMTSLQTVFDMLGRLNLMKYYPLFLDMMEYIIKYTNGDEELYEIQPD